MPSRNMIEAISTVFGSLDGYCSNREEPLLNAGRPRWIQTEHSGRHFLKDAVLVSNLSFSASLKLARFDFSNRSFFFTSGFDFPEPPSILQPEDLDGGRLTAFLYEMKPSPIASPSEIRNVVEVADKVSTSDYGGHDFESVLGLFPKIRVFSTEGLSKDDSFKMFLLICLSDRRRIDQWIDEELAKTLSSVTELSPLAIPYETLCRSILDMDPSALFMALYRCLEALYAHSHTSKLMTDLAISKPWFEMAQMLEATLGWYPREEPSLEALLCHADLEDLEAVLAALEETLPEGSNLQTCVAKRIYRLRNAVVHYRPFQQQTFPRKVNWNRLCESMSVLVFGVYSKINIPSQGSPEFT